MPIRSNLDIAADLRRLSDELAGISDGGNLTAANKYPPVFDLQTLGYTKIGAVEAFRDELNASLDPLAKRYVATLPHWWYVQDAEDYVEMTNAQKSLQEFNCGNARFSIAIMGSSAEDDSIWRTFVPAVVRTYNEDTMKFEDEPITHDYGDERPNAPVYAVANDSRASQNTSSRVLKKNPRVADMDKVVRASYAYFVKVNRDAILPMSDIGNAFGNR